MGTRTDTVNWNDLEDDLLRLVNNYNLDRETGCPDYIVVRLLIGTIKTMIKISTGDF